MTQNRRVSSSSDGRISRVYVMRSLIGCFNLLSFNRKILAVSCRVNELFITQIEYKVNTLEKVRIMSFRGRQIEKSMARFICRRQGQQGFHLVLYRLLFIRDPQFALACSLGIFVFPLDPKSAVNNQAR